ncbi:MAG: zf-HC2 domain-containing protein [Labilithrix sp.]|nr:zf-HC2 domain-containing protein [Labilithrix sp.]
MTMTAPDCKSVSRLLGAHLDGQLDAVKTLEVEDHLTGCEVCCERIALDRAVRGSLKKAVKSTTTPSDVRARMLAAMAGEAAREEQRDVALEAPAELSLDATARPLATTAKGSRPPMMRHWRTMLPLASAAALVMAWGYAGEQPVVRGMPDTVVAGLNDDILRDMVAQHKHPVPPEQQDPKQVRQFERYVGVPVVPQRMQNARFVGGRIMPLHGGERAAMLQYEVNQGASVQRVTVFVYDPQKIRVVGTNLAPRAVGTAEVRVGKTDGYTTAIAQHRGVGYASITDLDPESSASIIAAADHD